MQQPEEVTRDKRFRVAEVFGPTIQGEGRLAGTPAYFVRFGGCDFRCSWCDTPHAVLPEMVSQLPRLNSWEILQQLRALPSGPHWVVITGGNPLLLDLKQVCDDLIHDGGFNLMIETQGTIWQPWLNQIQDVCISPKPPSAGNITSWPTLWRFLNHHFVRKPYLKIVVFDDADYEYARDIHYRFNHLEMFLSVGNDDPELPTVGNPAPEKVWIEGKELIVLRNSLCHSYTQLCEKVARDRKMRDVRVMPQLHVLAWGNQLGH